MVTVQSIADDLATLPIEDLVPIALMLANRLHVHRISHGGRTPRALWKSVVEIGPSYACIELALSFPNCAGKAGGFFLKSRDTEDQGWQGMLTIPGVSLMPAETLGAAQERLIAECTDDSGLRDHLRFQMFANPKIKVEVHREDTDPRTEGRRVNCMTAVYVIDVPLGQHTLLKQGFVFVPRHRVASDNAIVDHHQKTLSGIMSNR